MRRTRKAINNLSLRKNIIRKAPIQNGIKLLCTSRAQNDVLEAALSQCTGPQCLCASCAQNDALEAALSQCTGPQCLCASCAQNDALEAALSQSAQAHSAYAHPVRRMMCLKQH